jgi:hypothetical protein
MVGKLAAMQQPRSALSTPATAAATAAAAVAAAPDAAPPHQKSCITAQRSQLVVSQTNCCKSKTPLLLLLLQAAPRTQLGQVLTQKQGPDAAPSKAPCILHYTAHHTGMRIICTPFTTMLSNHSANASPNAPNMLLLLQSIPAVVCNRRSSSTVRRQYSVLTLNVTGPVSYWSPAAA